MLRRRILISQFYKEKRYRRELASMFYTLRRRILIRQFYKEKRYSREQMLNLQWGEQELRR